MSPLKPHETRSVRARTILTPASGYLYAFTHTLNPYMGCAFGDGGCGVYCYVAESPIALFAGEPWGRWLSAKVNAAEALQRDICRASDPLGIRVFMSSATDPYQPAERAFGITRSILEVFQRRPIGLLVVQTRSPIVERDFDLLAEMPFAWLSMTVETDDDAVRRAITPTCPSIDRRLAAMRNARARGIHVQAAVSPTLPHNADRFADLLCEAADRIVIDTFSGDGADGKRTKRRPLPGRFAELGWGDWRDTSSAEQLAESLRRRLGPERIGWGKHGFNAIAAEVADATAAAVSALIR
jgi:DNA repair photolyase